MRNKKISRYIRPSLQPRHRQPNPLLKSWDHMSIIATPRTKSEKRNNGRNWKPWLNKGSLTRGNLPLNRLKWEVLLSYLDTSEQIGFLLFWTQAAIRKEAGEKSQGDGYNSKNRRYKTEYHETTPSTKDITSEPPKLTHVREKYKKHHDEPQENGYKRYNRGYEVQYILNGPNF